MKASYIPTTRAPSVWRIIGGMVVVMACCGALVWLGLDYFDLLEP